MASVSLYGLLIFFIIKSKIEIKLKILFTALLIILITLIAISRVYLGVHYFSDIIGASLMSIILLLIQTNSIDKK